MYHHGVARVIGRPPCCRKGEALNACARDLYQREVGGSFRLTGAWKGWRIQDGVLIGPRGVRWTPYTLEQAHAWQEFGMAGAGEVNQVLARVSAHD